MKIKLIFEKFKRYNKLVGISAIARRFFVMNSFDGVLTTMGVILGGSLGGIKSAKLIISAVSGGAIAMAISGISGAYFTEGAEREKELDELEKHTLTDLKDTEIGKAHNAATIFIAIIDGTSPLIAAMIILIPFFLHNFISLRLSYILSLTISFFILILLGFFLGNISKKNIFLSGFKMVLAGIICVILNLLLLK